MKKKEILEKPCFVIVKTVKIRYYYKDVYKRQLHDLLASDRVDDFLQRF